MAIKVTIKGVLHEYLKVNTYDKMHSMVFIIFRPAGTDDFGDKIGKDSYYKITAISNDPAKLEKIKALLRCKVEATCYLNGHRWHNDRGIYYDNQLRLAGDLIHIKTETV